MDLEQQGAGKIQNKKLNTKSLFIILLESTLGWTPTLQRGFRNIRVGEADCCTWFSALFFFLFFALDLLDAIFDLILSIRTTYYGSAPSGGNAGLGILLIVMTILGRVVYGMYGLAEADPNFHDNGDVLSKFLVMEATVFLLEDGAAILLLAADPGEKDTVETVSMYLTAIFGICYCIFFMLIAMGWIMCCGCLGGASMFFLIIPSCIMFEVVYFFKEVLLKGDDDDAVSGTLQIAAFIIYGIGAFLTVVMFLGTVWEAATEEELVPKKSTESN